MRIALPVFLLTACGSGTIDVSRLETPEDIADACERYEPDLVTLTVEVPARPPGCDWGQGDNLEMAQGRVTARTEDYVDLQLPDAGVVCGLQFEFQVDPQVEPTMEYDDHMFFLFNDVVLASSNADLVEPMPREDGLPVYDWSAVAGTPFEFQNNPTYCLGQETDRSDCTIPDPETRGSLLLSYEQSLVDELALRAVQQDRNTFGFVVIGDNDPRQDCRHEAFSFQVDVPYLTP